MSKFKSWLDKTFAINQGEDLLEDNSTKETQRPVVNTVRTARVDRPTPSPYREKEQIAKHNSAQINKAPVLKIEKTPSAKVHTFEPKSIDDAKRVIEYLSNGYAVLLNLENSDNALSQRIVDVVSGALFLLDGDYSIITDDIYLMAPKGVEISSPLSAESTVDKEIEKSASASTFSFRK